MYQKLRNLLMGILAAVWVALTALAWFTPAKDISDTERRALAQFPSVTGNSLLSGGFMKDFETYTLDQFPGRDTLRQIKALFHYNVLNQQDNNGIYLVNGYAAKLEYPLNTQGLDHALKRFNWVYENLLAETGSPVFCAVIPDKNYYLASEKGCPVMDYDLLFSTVAQQMDWAQHISLTDTLQAEDYYRTDLHWRQEALLPTAQKLCRALGVTPPAEEDYSKNTLDRPFYGVYHGQAALPLAPEDMVILESPLLDSCRTYNYETGSYTGIYDLEKSNGKDQYDVYLSGPQSLLRIENPNADTEKELVIFRDSFASSIAPLLVHGYKTVTLVDIRYISPQLLDKYITLDGQDILFLYSTSVLNNGSQLK